MSVEKKIMRDVFIEGIYNRMFEDLSLFFLTADFGSPKLDRLKEDFKDRFINVGIAEQNLINISTGLALEGFTVYTYGIAPFLTMRAYEQIRNNISLSSCVTEINVNLIGVGAGLSYDVSGPTHHCIEDISIIRVLPNIILFSPSDCVLVEKFIDYTIKIKKPKYARFDGKPLVSIYENKDVGIEKGFFELVKGDELCIVSTGFITHTALKVAEELLIDNIPIGVIDVFLLKPLNEDLFYEKLSKYEYVITLEEGFINKGGLDSLVSSILNKKSSNIKLKRMGLQDIYAFEMGARDYLHKLNMLDKESIVKILKERSFITH